MASLDLAFSKVKYWNQNTFVNTSDPAIRYLFSLANSLLKISQSVTGSTSMAVFRTVPTNVLKIA
jgi:hypothetical protein